MVKWSRKIATTATINLNPLGKEAVMIGYEKPEGRAMKHSLMDYVYESRFFIVNLLGIIGIWFVVTHLSIFLVCIFNTYTRMFFVTGFLHRYFSHRTFVNTIPPWRWLKTLFTAQPSYLVNHRWRWASDIAKTSPEKRKEVYVRTQQFGLAFAGSSAAQKGALWWAAHHRHHHKHSDTAEDIHSFDFVRKETGSFLKGLYWSHVGWVLDKEYKKVDYSKISDLSKYPELMFLEKWYGYLIAPTLLGIACFVLGKLTGVGGWAMLLGGFFTSTFLTYHFTFFINSLAHMVGKARFKTGEESKNCAWLNIFTLGEGWHNNHHKNQFTAAQGITPEEQRSDITLQILRLWQRTGMIKIVREYTPEEVEEARHLDEVMRFKKAT